MSMITVDCKLLNKDAALPEYMSDGAAGMDLKCIENIRIDPHEFVCVSTGVALHIPSGVMGKIMGRSGLALRHAVDVLGGVIDSDYRGEIKVILINHGSETVYLNHGYAIAQIVFIPICIASLKKVKHLESTTRGHQGFGSTDTISLPK